jgi:deoxyadenosine/deoxycytidine kinase
MHKIAFSGIPGSGKTSILAEVKKLLSLKFRVEEVPDLKLNSPFDFDQKAGFVSQFFFISNQINEENIRSLARPDFLLCDGSLLDQWLEWQRCLAEKQSNGQMAEKNALLENLYRFWIPTYAATFRIRVDVKILKKRVPKTGLREYPLDLCPQLDELYSQIIQLDRLRATDIWNHQSVDESAHEVMKQITDLKLI